MSTNNIAIVIGPNLLWPKEESADPASMVTETALQRRLCEMLIDHCRDFFPDLPAISTPPVTSNNTNKWASVSSPPPSSPWSAFQGYPPPTYRPLEIPSVSSTQYLPHPLADNAADEGVTVHMMNDESTPSPTEKPLPVLPPVPPSKPHASSRLSGGSHSPPSVPRQGNPPYSTSPMPKPRTASSSSNSSFTSAPSSVLHVRNSSGELSDNVITENGQAEGGPPVASRPTPPVRPRRQMSNNPSSGNSPAPPPKPAPYSPSTLERRMAAAGRTPQRKAPPPPVSRPSKPYINTPPPSSVTSKDELTSL